MVPPSCYAVFSAAPPLPETSVNAWNSGRPGEPLLGRLVGAT